MIKKDALASSKKIRRKKTVFRLAFYFFIVFCIGALFVGFFYIPEFKIKEIEIKGVSEPNKEKLKGDFLKVLQEKYLGLFPYNNIFIFPEKKLKAEMLEIYPDIKSMDFKNFFPEKILITAEERDLFAVWCFKEEDCFFLDKEGFVFKKSPFFYGSLFLKFFDERSASSSGDIAKGRQLLSKNDFKNLISFNEFVVLEGITIIKIFVKDDGVYDLETNSGWHIIINNDNGAWETFQNLKIMMDSLVKENHIDKIDYIDLRFGNKIFYKISNE